MDAISRKVSDISKILQYVIQSSRSALVFFYVIFVVMDVVITLPKKLITAIVSGAKTIEFRKSYPKEFDCRKDCVYIIENGTRNVVAYFLVSDFQFEYDIVEIWRNYSIQIGVPFFKFMAYAPRCRSYYLWRIRKAAYLYTPLDRKLSFGLTANPKGFVYAKYNSAPTGKEVR